MKRSLELYVHIPFCAKKCAYCDFLSFGKQTWREETKRAYVTGLCAEIESYHVLSAQYEIVTIYFGGGTPSLLSEEEIALILKTIKQNFSVREDAEITLECNPGTTNLEKFFAWRDVGINRLSIGLQSTSDEMLARLGRIHTFAQFETQYAQARRAGFTNISVDLMSALPGQTLEDYREDLNKVITLNPEHISSYGLILEEHTPFYEDASIRQSLPDEDTALLMYEETKERLKEAGYDRYEISNYAKSGYESRHNKGYWTGVPYLGVGLGASSYLILEEGKTRYLRFHNPTELKEYDMQEKGKNAQEAFFARKKTWQEVEELTEQDRMEEFVFLGLRMREGISFLQFERLFHVSFLSVYEDAVKKNEAAGMVRQIQKNGEVRLCLTDAGIEVSNQVFLDFLF